MFLPFFFSKMEVYKMKVVEDEEKLRYAKSLSHWTTKSGEEWAPADWWILMDYKIKPSELEKGTRMRCGKSIETYWERKQVRKMSARELAKRKRDREEKRRKEHEKELAERREAARRRREKAKAEKAKAEESIKNGRAFLMIVAELGELVRVEVDCDFMCWNDWFECRLPVPVGAYLYRARYPQNVGDNVVVPFGRHGICDGTVVQVLTPSDVENIKDDDVLWAHDHAALKVILLEADLSDGDKSSLEKKRAERQKEREDKEQAGDDI